MMKWCVLMQAGSTLEKYPHNPQKPQSGMNSEDVEDVFGDSNPLPTFDRLGVCPKKPTLRLPVELGTTTSADVTVR